MKKPTKKVTKKEVKKPAKKVIHRSSKTGKLVSKSFAAKHKATTQAETVQTVKYWKKRPLDDKDRDWGYGKENWVQDYVASVAHPHRARIIELLKRFEWSYLLEVGCCTGPNLALIREHFPDKALFGIEPNEDAVKTAKEVLPTNITVTEGTYNKIPYAENYFDVVLADATLMYASPDEIGHVMDELARVAAKAIVIVDRFTEKDSTESHVWSRNYAKLLSDRDFVVKQWDVTEEDWGTSKNWVKYGKYWLGTK